MKEHNKVDEKYSRRVLALLLLVSLLVILVISLSFTIYIREQKENTKHENNTNQIIMKYTEDTNGISIQNAVPLTDEVGKAQTNENEYFDFTVQAKVDSEKKIEYEIAIVKDKSSTIPDKDIKIYLEEQKNGTYVQSAEPTNFVPIKSKTDIGAPVGTMVLKKVHQSSSLSKNYRLKMWINKDAIIDTNNSYTVRVNVYGKQVK